MSGANVFTDVARKKALADRSLIPATFWCKVFTALVFGAALVFRIVRGSRLEIREGGNLFGLAGVHLTPVTSSAIAGTATTKRTSRRLHSR